MSKKYKKKTIKRYIYRFLILFIVAVFTTYFLLVAFKPLPKINAIGKVSPVVNIPTLAANWPSAQESSVGVLGFGKLSSYGLQKQTQTASIAKIVTALAVLKMKPLQMGEQGPTITIGASDVEDYISFVGQNGSVVKVQQGEQISEYQALQAMLLPSANNMADTLAVWAFGSTPNYLNYTKQVTDVWGMKNTVIADPSGFSPSTLSTSDDLILLGEQAMSNPVLAQIVNQTSADIPVAGIVYNVNPYLGVDNIVGIKTGNTDQAGGCFLIAATFNYPGNQSITIIASVMKAPTLENALKDGQSLINSVKIK